MKSATGNLFLVGLMGSGKSTVGRQLALLLGKTFMDSDHEIERRTGVRIPVIFDVEGESGFRRREAEVIDELTQGQDLVIATGGGSILDPATREVLRTRGHTIYLSATHHDLWMRTRHDKNRPLLQHPDPRARLEELLNQREEFYRDVADIVVETGRPSVNRLAAIIVERLTELDGFRHPHERTDSPGTDLHRGGDAR